MKKSKGKLAEYGDYASEKRIYTQPKMEVICIEMEQCLAAQSAVLNPGNINSPVTPQMEEWNNKESLGGKDFDL
ncbi:hypothetical protein [Elizabethkingia ursingii]|uniref:Uncharacterized protein n=1 Tax=Elizabethkingia ursingii TaxID=1756150 RepID=A0ABX3NAH8_9FLAO|nr:hypothetical protein [Elizabethkingia ursingii]OPB88511.1 hypothetical protein BB021_08150 [Elizabethkingia ursingii]